MAKKETKWCGIFKVMEEAGELVQILGKICAFPSGIHPRESKKGTLKKRAQEELADTLATIEYFIERDGGEHLSWPEIDRRRALKLEKFRKFGLPGIKP